jgi:hypothetical protein
VVDIFNVSLSPQCRERHAHGRLGHRYAEATRPRCGPRTGLRTPPPFRVRVAGFFPLSSRSGSSTVTMDRSSSIRRSGNLLGRNPNFANEQDGLVVARSGLEGRLATQSGRSRNLKQPFSTPGLRLPRHPTREQRIALRARGWCGYRIKRRANGFEKSTNAQRCQERKSSDRNLPVPKLHNESAPYDLRRAVLSTWHTTT